MVGSLLVRWVMAGALGVALAPALAAVELAGAAPKSVLDGVQADNSTGPLQQAASSSVAGTLESIVWWGFHGSNSLGSFFDDFVVSFNGNAQSGALDKTPDANGVSGLTRYELDIADMALVPGPFVLEVVNDSLDVEWFWQYDDKGRGGLAYALLGTQAAPEPQSLALALLSLAAFAAIRRTRRSQS